MCAIAGRSRSFSRACVAWPAARLAGQLGARQGPLPDRSIAKVSPRWICAAARPIPLEFYPYPPQQNAWRFPRHILAAEARHSPLAHAGHKPQAIATPPSRPKRGASQRCPWHDRQLRRAHKAVSWVRDAVARRQCYPAYPLKPGFIVLARANKAWFAPMTIFASHCMQRQRCCKAR